MPVGLLQSLALNTATKNTNLPNPSSYPVVTLMAEMSDNIVAPTVNSVVVAEMPDNCEQCAGG